MKNQRKNVARLSCCAAIFGVGAPVVSRLAICGADDQRDHRDDAEPDERDAEDPGGQALGLRLVARPRGGATKVGTSTAESAPAASSSNRTFDTELDRLERVAEVGGAEDRGDHPDADEPDAARQQRRGAHAGRRAVTPSFDVVAKAGPLPNPAYDPNPAPAG